MAIRPLYLADKSALARSRLQSVGTRLGPLIEEGLLATCAIVDLEVLYSARTLIDYRAIREERGSLPDAPITPAVMRRAIDIQQLLAERGQHRLAIPDLVVAAAAEAGELTVLHYDADFERIAAVAAIAHEWVVPRGSV